ncbi:putative ribonuclease H-like domain-containing protein [Tanacetum coccineum]
MVKPVWNNAQRVNHQSFAKKTHPCAKKNMVPRAVLMKSGLVSVNNARQVNTAHLKTTVNAARPMSYLSKTTHSTVKRPIHKNTTFKNSNLNQRVNTVRGNNVYTARLKAVVNAVKGNNLNAVKASACWVWKPKTKVLDHGNPQMDLQDQGVIDSGCSRHMTGNMSYLTDYEEIDGGYVAFGGNPKGGKIIGKGTIKTGNLDFENVYFLIDESQVLLRVPRKNNMYSVDLKNIVPKGGLTCLFAKATSDESKLWHRRLGHLNFKTMNKLVKGNLVRGLPSKLFENDQTCVACQKGKQHRASSTKDETSGILKSFITRIENLVDHKVKVIRCDNGTEFKNREMNQFCEMKGILRQYSIARTPQKNGVAERRMLGLKDILLPLKLVLLVIEVTTAGFFVLLVKTARNILKTLNSKPSSDDGKKVDEDLRKDSKCNDQEKEDNVNSTNNVNAASTNEVNDVGAKTSIKLPVDPNILALEDISIFDFTRDDEDDSVEADINNLNTTIQVSPNQTTRIHKDHPLDQVIGDLQSATQTRNMSKNLKEHGRTIKANSCIKGSKLDKGYTERASTIQAETRVWTLSGFTRWKKSSGPIDNVADEAVNEEIDDSLEMAATTATSLDAKQDRGNINKTQSKATPNDAGSQGTTSGGGPRCQETMGDTIAQTRFENVSKTSNDPLLARGKILSSGEDNLKLNELMELCTNLQQMVLDLETIKTTQANEIASLKRRVKKIERRNKSRTHRLKRMYRVGLSRSVKSSKDGDLGEEDASKQGRITDIDANKDIYLVNVHTDEDMFGVNDLDCDEVIVDNVDVVKTAKETRSVVEEITAVIEKAKLVRSTTTTTKIAIIIDVEITLAQALAELKSAKPKAVKVVIQEPEQGTTTTTPTTIISVPKPPQDKGKGIMIEEPVVEQVKPMKRLEQIRLDEELAFKLQAEEEEEEERLAREKAHQTEEANIAWDDVQAKIEVDYQLAQRLQAQELEELTDEEKARLFVQFLEQRRKHFAAKRAEEKSNRPPKRAQQRSIMCTYLLASIY